MTAPRRVLYVHHGSGQGGAAVSLLHLLHQLDCTRYEPVVVVDVGRPNAVEFFSTHGFPPILCVIAPFTHTMKTWSWYTPRGLAKLLRWRLIQWPAARRAFKTLLDAARPDLVHLNGLSLAPMARVADDYGIPVVQHVRESVNEGVFGVRKWWLTQLVSRHARRVIYICQDNADRLKRVRVPGTVIYNPVDIARFGGVDRGRVRAELSIPSDAPVLFFPGGSFLDIKGIEPFLQALAKICSDVPNTLAIVPGLGSERDGLIDALGLRASVMKVPFVADVERYFSACDVVVAPFTVPHFSRAVIEAGAARRPVVGSRIGGIIEVIDDRVTGLLAEPGDVVDLAKKVTYLLSHPDEASAMADAGFSLAAKRYDATLHARAVMDVYDRVLAT